MVILPPVLTFLVITEDREEYRIKTLKDLAFKTWLILIILPFGLLAFAAPIRSAMLAAGSFYTPVFLKINEIHHEIIYQHFIPRFGELFPYWLDFYWGIYGVCVIFIAAVMDSIRRNMLVRQIEILPTSKIQAAAIGLVELKGKAIPKDSKDKGPIIRSWIHTTDDGMSSRTSMQPFYLDDGTGQVLVDPEGCDVAVEDKIFNIKMHHAILKKFQPEQGFPEGRLMPGDETYVLGNLQINDDKQDRENKVVIKPQRTSLVRMNFYDLFFVSNTSEEQLLAAFKKSIKRGWFGVFVLMALTGWMSVYAWTNLVQIKDMDIEAAPLLFRLITTPTLLEREFKANSIISRPTLYWLEQLQQDPEKIDDITQAFKEQQLDFLAIPVLLQQARDIDHPSFAKANDWLGKLDAIPEGHWGYEYWNKEKVEEYAELNLPFAYRVLLEYKPPELFASYRFHMSNVTVNKRQGRVLRRYVLFEFVNKESGIVKESEFFIEPGWNNVDNVRLFEYFLPGEYSFDIYSKSTFPGNKSFRRNQNRKPIDIKF